MDTAGRQVIRRSLTAAAGAVVLVLVATLAVACGSGSTHGRATRLATTCGIYRRLSEDRARMVTGTGQRVVVIGDSWSVGRHLPHPARSWPVELPGEVHVAGFSGSGFSEKDMSKCGRVSFADRAPAALTDGANLVVVEGGINDVARSKSSIRRGFRRLMVTLAPYDVVVIGPATTPRYGNRSVRIDRLLHRLCDRVGVPYVSTLDIKLPYMPDGLHPTADGHLTFGRIVAERIGDVVPSRPLVGE